MNEYNRNPELETENLFEDQLMVLMEKMGANDYQKWIFESNNELLFFSKQELSKYKFWHIFVGGIYGNNEENPFGDLPSEHSLLKAVDIKLKEYESKT